jgi:hypothetical protein
VQNNDGSDRQALRSPQESSSSAGRRAGQPELLQIPLTARSYPRWGPADCSGPNAISLTTSFEKIWWSGSGNQTDGGAGRRSCSHACSSPTKTSPLKTPVGVRDQAVAAPEKCRLPEPLGPVSSTRSPL